jgi:hypothetical protein
LARYPEVRIADERARLVYGRGEFLDVAVEELFGVLVDNADRGPRWGLIPSGVRLYLERGGATALAVEIPPHTRTVKWIRDDSPEPYGHGATYGDYFIAFPYVLILVVLSRGEVTGVQQVFYRNKPLDVDEQLYLPKLPNVASTASFRSWICLQNLKSVARLSMCRKIEEIGNHVLVAAFNRSAELHEGNSRWSSMRGIDPRLDSIQAWQEATKSDPLFVTRIPWTAAGTTLTKELRRMLELVAPSRPIRSAAEVAGLMARVTPPKKGKA